MITDNYNIYGLDLNFLKVSNYLEARYQRTYPGMLTLLPQERKPETPWPF